MKFLKKKIVFIFAGCPERDPLLFPNDPEYICNRCTDVQKQKSLNCFTEQKSRTIKHLEHYSSFIISQDDSASYLEKLNPIWFYVTSAKPPDKDYLKKFDDKKFRLVHFPSNPKIKLSQHIIPVMERLSVERNDIDIEITSGISHSAVLEKLENSHILIDALGLGYGILAIEAMARGCIVITGKVDFIEKKIPLNPVIKSSINTLYDDLKTLLDDSKNFKIRAKQSMEFFEKYHSYESVGQFYKQLLNLK